VAPRLGIGKGEVLVKQQLGRANRAGRRRRGGRADRVGGWRGGGEGGDVADRADAARGANGGGAEKATVIANEVPLSRMGRAGRPGIAMLMAA
jgi:hypothetical protein